MTRIAFTCSVLSLGLALGCDTADGSTREPSDGGQAELSREMFEANAARQRGDESTAVDKYLSLCKRKHTPACEEIMPNAANDAALKQKLCFEASYTPAC